MRRWEGEKMDSWEVGRKVESGRGLGLGSRAINEGTYVTAAWVGGVVIECGAYSGYSDVRSFRSFR